MEEREKTLDMIENRYSGKYSPEELTMAGFKQRHFGIIVMPDDLNPDVDG